MRCASAAAKEICNGIVPISVEALAQPGDRLSVRAELQLSNADPYQPLMGEAVAGGNTERFVDVTFGFRSATKKVFGKSDETVGESTIMIQRHGVLALSNALRHAVCIH